MDGGVCLDLDAFLPEDDVVGLVDVGVGGVGGVGGEGEDDECQHYELQC